MLGYYRIAVSEELPLSHDGLAFVRESDHKVTGLRLGYERFVPCVVIELGKQALVVAFDGERSQVHPSGETLLELVPLAIYVPPMPSNKCPRFFPLYRRSQPVGTSSFVCPLFIHNYGHRMSFVPRALYISAFCGLQHPLVY